MAVDALPPGPRGSFLFGNLAQLRKGPLEFFLKTAREFGDLASFRLGRRRFFLASRPDLVEQVLVTDAKHYIKHFGLRLHKPVLGEGLLTSEGDVWLQQRRLMQPAFLKNRIAALAPVVADVTRRYLQNWREGTRLDIRYEFSGLTSAIALKTFFGIDESGDRHAFTQALGDAFNTLVEDIRNPLSLPHWVPTAKNLKLKRSISQLKSVVDGFIAQGKARKEPGDDLLSRLIAARDEDGKPMPDRLLRDEAMTLYLAGHDTTALVLTWTWWFVARHPEVERKLLEEWSRVLSDRTPTMDDLPRMIYTNAVLAESMRLCPPAYLLGREAVCDLELGGYRVRKGCTIFMSQWVAHRDPRYFADPEEFRPERWLDANAEKIPRYAYYPFGGGPRICIGNNFALMEAAIILPMVGRMYQFTLEPEPKVEFSPQIVLVPKNGVPAILKQRFD